MTTRRPLVTSAGRVCELPAGDTLPPATELDLPNQDTGTPDAVAVQFGGVWKAMSWAAFIALIGSVAPPPTGNEVTINGEGVTIGGDTVIITLDALDPNQVLINGEGVTVQGQALVIRGNTSSNVTVNGEDLVIDGVQVTIT